VKARLWGTRGSQASPGPDTARYGGNTSCVQVEAADSSVLVLDAGTGIRRLGTVVRPDVERIDILLTHLHMDHIQGLGFFAPLRQPGLEVHIWGPASTTMGLQARITRYLSPPLFPVRLLDLDCELYLHETGFEPFEVPGATVLADRVCHAGPTVGYRIEHEGSVLTYISDHEPRLGSHDFPNEREWMSGYALAHGADLLIHDAQYTEVEYEQRRGWGHSTLVDAVRFATACEVSSIVLFHHDPAHDDETLDHLVAEARATAGPGLEVQAAHEDDVLSI
jgi:phosphoribosyl 1,2-cyclic phosphodiesterase